MQAYFLQFLQSFMVSWADSKDVEPHPDILFLTMKSFISVFVWKSHLLIQLQFVCFAVWDLVIQWSFLRLHSESWHFKKQHFPFATWLDLTYHWNTDFLIEFSFEHDQTLTMHTSIAIEVHSVTVKSSYFHLASPYQVAFHFQSYVSIC